MKLRSNLHYVAWTVSLIATFGSLFFSEIMKLPPCVLCWYQRIAMYPIALILPIGILFQDKWIGRYIIPLSLVGLGISSYHVLLYYGVIPESIVPCTQGVSCTSRQIEWFGFMTIPLLSMIGFILINLSMFFYTSKKESHYL